MSTEHERQCNRINLISRLPIRCFGSLSELPLSRRS
jgi:hypothetical protein